MYIIRSLLLRQWGYYLYHCDKQILKAEIRRYERNAEREHHIGDQAGSDDPASDLKDGSPTGVTRREYLKNVLLRFLCANSSGDAAGALERSALVPVLTTLLALSPSERGALQQVAESGVLKVSGSPDKDGQIVTEGSSWGRLLPTWLSSWLDHSGH